MDEEEPNYNDEYAEYMEISTRKLKEVARNLWTAQGRIQLEENLLTSQWVSQWLMMAYILTNYLCCASVRYEKVIDIATTLTLVSGVGSIG